MEKKKLPIGIQTFAKIRDPKENYIYVDKTEIAYQLVNRSTYYFLSRPRRFGKSLFVDTLDSLFSASKKHFEGLYIYDKWDWAESYPVIRIDFSNGSFSNKEEIIFSIKEIIRLNTERHSISFDEIETEYVGTLFSRLILALYEKYNQKVVILIDEYDKPILDNISRNKKENALLAREVLRNFYSSIKASDQYLKFFFMTGVSKFSKLNLFSGLNNIEDITIDSNYATITGYTQNDLEVHFEGYLEGMDKEAIKKWYNGYNYFGEPIYNPFDILLFFSNNGQFNNYWWETGNPAFFIEKLKEENYFLPDLENIEVSRETLNAFDVEHIDFVALLWQTGYLTFAEKIVRNHRISYKMKVPNLEIQYSLNTLFLDFLTNFKHTTIQKQTKAFDALYVKDGFKIRSKLTRNSGVKIFSKVTFFSTISFSFFLFYCVKY